MPSDHTCDAKKARGSDRIGSIDETSQRGHVLKLTKGGKHSLDILYLMVRDKIQLQNLEKKTRQKRNKS